MRRDKITNRQIIQCAGKALISSTEKMIKRNGVLYRSFALVLAVAMIFTMNFSVPVTYAENGGTEKVITAFADLDDGIAVQNIEYNASEDSIVFPDSLNATVETYKDVIVEETIETPEEEVLEDEIITEETDETTEDETEELEETEEESSEAELTEEEYNEDLTSEEEAEEDDVEDDVEETEEIVEENNDESSDVEETTESEITEEGTTEDNETNETTSEENVSEDTSNEVSNEAPAAEQAAPAAESEPTSTDDNTTDSTDPIAFIIDVLFPAIEVQAAEVEEIEENATEPTETATVEEVVAEPVAEVTVETSAEEIAAEEIAAEETVEAVEAVEYTAEEIIEESATENSSEEVVEVETADSNTETSATPVVNTETVTTSTEITITGITWTLDGSRSTRDTFDSSIEGATYVYVANVNTEYTINAALPTIKVVIGTNGKSPAFEQSAVVNGILITVKADPGVFPEDARLVAVDASEEMTTTAESAVETIEEEKNIVDSYVFDISIVDGAGNEIQPDTTQGEVSVSFTMAEVADEEIALDVYHIPDINNAEETVEKLETEEVGDTIEAETTSFSPFVVRTSTAGAVTIGNYGYPYGQNMGSGITFIVDISDHTAGSYKWYVSGGDPQDFANYTEISGKAGEFTADATTIQTTFSGSELTNNKWYYVAFCGSKDLRTMPVQAYNNGRRWYISNGQMGYSIISGTTFDVVGKYKGSWIAKTSYDSYWNWYTSSQSNPSPSRQSGTGPRSSANLEYNKPYFYENDYDGSQNNSTTSGAHALLFDTKLAASEHAFSFGCDVMIRSNDSAPCMGVFSSGRLKQIQLVDANGIENSTPDSAALVVRTDIDFPTNYYIGHWSPRTMYDYATRDNNSTNAYRCTFDEYGHATMISGADSGITVSWLNLEGGATITYAFNLGTVAQTGAVTGEIDYENEVIEVDKASTTYEITIINEDGTEEEPILITSDSHKDIKLSGKDDTQKDYDFCGKRIRIAEHGGSDQPLELDIAPRPIAEEAETTGTDDQSDAVRPSDVGDDIIVTTETTITLNIDLENSGRMLQEYRVYDKDGKEISGQGWLRPNSRTGKVEFTGLTPNTEYTIKTRVPANVNTPASAVSRGVKAWTKGTVTVTIPENLSRTYDGTAVDYSVIANPSDATVEYSYDENQVYSNNAPIFKNAGEYTVYYKATKENFRTAYGSFTVNIGKQTSPEFYVYSDKVLKISALAVADKEVSLEEQISDLREDDQVVLLNDGWDPPYSVEFDNIIVDLTKNGDSLVYTVNDSEPGTTGYIYFVVSNDNYSEYVLVVPVETVEVIEEPAEEEPAEEEPAEEEPAEEQPAEEEPAEEEPEEEEPVEEEPTEEPVITVPVEETATVEYDGKPHSFPVIVEIEDAVVTYSDKEDGEFTTDVPTYTDAGEYVVFYSVEKDGEVIAQGNYEVRIVNNNANNGDGENSRHYASNVAVEEEVVEDDAAIVTSIPETVEETTVDEAPANQLSDLIETEDPNSIGKGNIIDRGDIWGDMTDDTKQKLLDKLDETGGEIIQVDDLENSEAIAVNGMPIALIMGEGSVIVTMELKNESRTNAGLVDATAVANSILTDEQRAAVLAGSILEIKVEVAPIDRREVSEFDRNVISDGVKANAEEKPYLTMADYIDISMFFRIDDSDWNRVTDTDPIDIVIDIHDDYKGLSDNYYIMRAHEGQHTLLEDLDDNADTITISTGQFSTYALMYDEIPTAAVEEVNVADKCNLCHICPTFLGICYFVWLAIILAIVITIKVYRKLRRQEEDRLPTTVR